MQIVLFHSALGLRAVEHALAATLPADGHDVRVPDLYDGRTAATVEDGLALKDAVGWAAILDRARDALRDAPPDSVLAGVSMGAGVISELWPERPATPAVLLLHGYAVIPVSVAPGVRVSLHVAVGDRFAPEDVIAEWQSAAAKRGIDVRVYRYPDVGHFFTDPALPDYDEQAAGTASQRLRTFLGNLD